MKGTIYPKHVSNRVIRGNALLTIITSGVVLVTSAWWIATILAVDFFIRGFLNPRWSAFSLVSKVLLSRIIPGVDKSIFFPPKQFAARVGLVFSLTAAALYGLGAVTAGGLVIATLSIFAALECFFNVCMGCIVYNSVIVPLRGRRLQEFK